jgi:integrase/recombinase XerD
MKQEVDAFLDYLRRERGVSENTLAAYQNDLSQLILFLQEKAPGKLPSHWSGVNEGLLLSYLINLKQRSYAPSTIARKVATTKSLFKFLASRGAVRNIPFTALKSPQIKRASPHLISQDQVQKLLKQPEKSSTPEAKRDKAMLELLYATGMQVSEIVALNLEDVNIREGYVYCYGKGSKKRILTIPLETVQYLHCYLDEARPQLVSNHQERALFLNRLGQRLTRQGFWLILKGYAEAANLKIKVTPRILRHSVVAQMLDQGADLHAVQQKLGYANISTAQVYTQLSP